MMLKREDAQKLLQQEKNQHWLKEAPAAINHDLPPELRATACALLDRDEHGGSLVGYAESDRKRRADAFKYAIAQFETLSSGQCQIVFNAMMPGISDHLQAAWDLIGRLPYQTGYERRAFRLREANATIAEQRFHWLRSIITFVGPYRQQDIAWLVAWAPHLGGPHMLQPLGVLFAATIDSGGEQGNAVVEILTASARGEHEIGVMGRHVTTGLLASGRPEAWDFVERLLIAAQREEGLRQVILEAVDESHPEAFRRMLRLILDRDLVRFSATIRAADVWFGFAWTVDDVREVRTALADVLDLLADPDARIAALTPKVESTPAPAPVTGRSARADNAAATLAARAAARRTYLALWVVAYQDAIGAVHAATSLLHDVDPLRRLACAHLLAQLRLTRARAALVPAIDDTDLRVALTAFNAVCGHRSDIDPKMFDICERLLARLNAKTPLLESGIWPWLQVDARIAAVADSLLRSLGTRPPTRLIPYLSQMSSWGQIDAAKKLAAVPEWDTTIRAALFAMVAGRSSYVRQQALNLIGDHTIVGDEALPLEALLGRKSSDTRRAVLTILLKQGDIGAMKSAERLLATPDPRRRIAGLDMLRDMVDGGRHAGHCQGMARAFRDNVSTLTADEETMLGAILDDAHLAPVAATLENVLGLINQDDLSKIISPRPIAAQVNTPAARAYLLSLDALIEANRTTAVILPGWRGREEQLLGNIRWLPQPTSTRSARDDVANLPLADLWQDWDRNRPTAMRDKDGLELYRALLMISDHRYVRGADTPASVDDAPDAEPAGDPATIGQFLAQLGGGILGGAGAVVAKVSGSAARATTPHVVRLRHRPIIQQMLDWFVRLAEPPPPGTTKLVLDAAEAACAALSSSQLQKWIAALATSDHKLRQKYPRQISALAAVHTHLTWHPHTWTGADHVRHWQLLHWLDQPLPGMPRLLPELEVVLRANSAGAATEADILDQLVAPAKDKQQHFYSGTLRELNKLSSRQPHALVTAYPVLLRIIPALRERIVTVELARGEMPTDATLLAQALRYAGGMAEFMNLLVRLASSDLVRGYLAHETNKASVFSYLLRGTYPGADDSYEEFARLITANRIDRKLLVAAAVYAPQWARHVEQALGWPQLENAIWWIHAHTKDTNWSVDQALKDAWQAQAAERTPLSAKDLLDGAVDVAWFGRSHEGLGDERWEMLYAAAKYASGGTGHARARLFADAMTGALDAEDLQRRISTKRHQDAVRALGLLPLPADAAKREAMVTARYQAVQEFIRTGKKFGAQRRASEATAARVGLENLSRTAGYPDPIRLQWAMERHLGADLKTGAIAVEHDGVTVSLALDPLSAEPAITVARNGKTLKTLPAALKKVEAVAALYARERDLIRQAARMRISLEGAMCRGDRFTPAEIAGILDHPVLARQIRNLLFVREAATVHEQDTVLGYPTLDGDAEVHFRAHDGRLRAAFPGTPLRLAHPHDLYAGGKWHAWQHDCFTTERIQPFKQVFRELYVLTENETRLGDEASSARYSGQQVQPNQAMALFNARGWVGGYDWDGTQRTFHAEGLTAHAGFDRGYGTAAEVEGMTIGTVHFTKRDQWKPIALATVPPRLFSEVMRDLDLVVSVAHRGGVDPEATASTVEMRAALVRETCALLDIANVTLKSSHVLIEGTLGSYSIHLGSAIVHRQPGGSLCIVPVHGQHRGRIFLPFADDDPRTAEVVSKVVMLARDAQIKDPSILEQIL
jgi:Family of unknown function (DUF5724)/Domain of unknown function (DUF4132)